MSKIYTADQIRLHAVDEIDQAIDPTTGGGVAAAIGSFYLRSGTAGSYLKTGAANTAWTKLAQSYGWLSVADYGAAGNGIIDDTAAVQAALNDAATAGGNVVYFPHGTYAVTQLTLNAQSNVQLRGAGSGSIIKWVWNAASAPGSMLTITGATQHVKIETLQFDGSGLTNPVTGNHLIQVGTGVGSVVETQIVRCTIGNMVAGSGDAIHVLGAAGNLVSRLWISDNVINGAGRHGIGVEQGWEFGWIQHNYITASPGTDIAFISTADVNTNAILILGNEIVHTGAVRHAMRFEGGATTFITRLTLAANVCIGGFATVSNVQFCIIDGNVQTSGSFASTDGMWRLFGTVFELVMTANLFDREAGSSAGPVVSLEKATTSPSTIRVGYNQIINEKQGANFVNIIDCSRISVGSNTMRSSDAGTSTMFGIDVQAVTGNVTDILLSGNQLSAATGSMKAAVRLLCNGANVLDITVGGNQGSSMDYGWQQEIGGGGGTFSGQALFATNNFDSTVGYFNAVGVTVRPRVGFNAGPGSNLFTGNGTPETNVTAPVSSVYLRMDGGQATSVYYKETGAGNTGWVGIGGAPIIFGTGDTSVAATRVFLAPGWIATAIATEIQFAITRPGTIRNFYVRVATAGVTAGANTYTVRKNGVDTTIVATIDNATSGTASDTTHNTTVVAGDLLSIGLVKAGVVATGQSNVTATIEQA